MHNGGSVDVLLHGEYGYGSVESYCYSREWLWNTRAKISHQGSEMPVGFHYRNLISGI